MTSSASSRIVYTHDTVASTDGVTTFNVTASFYAEGDDLPEGVSGVFLKRAVVPTDPKSDIFVRVAQLSDLGTAASSREIALDPARYRPAAGTYIRSSTLAPGHYLTQTLTLAFDDLAVAIQAKKILEQRVDSLLSSWKTYRDSFHAVTQATFPMYDAAIVAAAKKAYYAADDALTQAESTRKTAEDALASAEEAYASATTELTRVEQVKSLVCPSVTSLEFFLSEHDKYFAATGGRTSLRSVIESVLPTVSVASTREALEHALATDAAAYGVVSVARNQYGTPARTNFTTACSTLDAQRGAASVAQSTAGSQRASSGVAVETASAAVQERQAEKNAALVAVLAVCPSFKP